MSLELIKWCLLILFIILVTGMVVYTIIIIKKGGK